MQMKKTLCPAEPTVTGRSGSIAKDIFRKKLPIPGTIGIGSLKKKGDEVPDCTAFDLSIHTLMNQDRSGKPGFTVIFCMAVM